METSPAFQWYPKDILSSARVAEMSLAEEGAYRRLIDFCWLNGSIPADPIRASRLVGKGCTREITEAVLPMFTPDPADPTRLLHDRLDEERRKQKELSLKRTQAANARWNGATQGTIPLGNKQVKAPECKCNASAIQVQCSSSSSSSSNKEEKHTKEILFEESAERIWKVYPKKDGKKEAIKAIIKRLKEGLTEEYLIERVNAYAICVQGEDKRFIKHAQGWFNGERYLDEALDNPKPKQPQQPKQSKEEVIISTINNNKRLFKALFNARENHLHGDNDSDPKNFNDWYEKEYIVELIKNEPFSTMAKIYREFASS